MQLQDKSAMVAVGRLLASDDFQMVLDADNTSESTNFSSFFQF